MWPFTSPSLRPTSGACHQAQHSNSLLARTTPPQSSAPNGRAAGRAAHRPAKQRRQPADLGVDVGSGRGGLHAQPLPLEVAEVEGIGAGGRVALVAGVFHGRRDPRVRGVDLEIELEHVVVRAWVRPPQLSSF